MLLQDYDDLISVGINKDDEKFLIEKIIELLATRNFSISDTRILFRDILIKLERENPIIKRMKNHENV